MMSEAEYNNRMDRLARARQRRDEASEAAQERFIDDIVDAYGIGLTIYDIGHATGLSITTVRKHLKGRGVQMRKHTER
jgi:DNA-directed RNA polymerase specialized sigma24 family protein